MSLIPRVEISFEGSRQMMQKVHRPRPTRPRVSPERRPIVHPRQAPQAMPPRQILSESQRMRAVRLSPPVSAARPVPLPRQRPGMPPVPLPPRSAAPSKSGHSLLLLAALGGFSVMAALGVSLILAVLLIYGGGVLPGVRVGGIPLGGLSEAEAAAALQNAWTTLTLRDGDREFAVNPAAMGITLDAAGTAAAAYRQGRREGHVLRALLNADVPPVIVIDTDALANGLESIRAEVDILPVNAGVALVDGVVRATPPQNGRSLDAVATATSLQAGDMLADGEIQLVMRIVAPAVSDSSPMVQAAQQLLTNALIVTAYDPATGNSIDWSAPPEIWARWLTAVSAPGTATGLALSVQAAPVRDFLTTQAQVFDASRYLNLDEAVGQVQTAVAASTTTVTVRVYHRERQHVVQSGETIVSIAYAYGVPYPFVQQANGGIEALSIGQTITIPSVDTFLPYAVVPEKRIIVSIPQQRVRVYENGQMIHDWSASTGISSSPTWPGIYQILSHEPNAYAANWNLWMPSFMGVYQPVPGTDFTNGFHGFPTRGGGQILWENSLGTRVTYGCILLNNANAQWLYEWAETGVVVEIQG